MRPPKILAFSERVTRARPITGACERASKLSTFAQPWVIQNNLEFEDKAPGCLTVFNNLLQDYAETAETSSAVFATFGKNIPRGRSVCILCRPDPEHNLNGCRLITVQHDKSAKGAVPWKQRG